MKLLCAVAHRNTCTFAKKLIVSGFVNILKASPAAHIVDQNRFVLSVATYHISQKSSKFLSMFDLNPTLSSVRISRRHGIAMAVRVCLNGSFLVGDGILLLLCGHPHVLRCRNQGLCFHRTSRTKAAESIVRARRFRSCYPAKLSATRQRYTSDLRPRDLSVTAHTRLSFAVLVTLLRSILAKSP